MKMIVKTWREIIAWLRSSVHKCMIKAETCVQASHGTRHYSNLALNGNLPISNVLFVLVFGMLILPVPLSAWLMH